MGNLICWEYWMPLARALIAEMPDGQFQFGSSQIIAPTAKILASAGEKTEVLHAELDLDLIGQGLASLDTDGHYARHDVFEFRVNLGLNSPA